MIHIPIEISDTGPALTLDGIRQFQAETKIMLPEFHQSMLLQANGFSTYFGMFRFKGIVDREGGLRQWNENESWKFSWNNTSLDDYFCFYETVFGDQYAYKLSDLKLGNSSVYRLDALSMEVDAVSDSILNFWVDEILRNAKKPYDSLIVQAAEKYVNISTENHLIYAPSLLIEPTEDIENTQVLGARAAMILNGDLYVRLGGSLSDCPIDRIEIHQDNRGNARAKVIWKGDK